MFPAKPMKIVEIEVADGQVYPMFAEMLMHYSAYFSACLGNDSWAEAHTLKVKLEEPEWAPVLPLLIEWVTQSRIASTPIDTSINEVHDGELVYQEKELPTLRHCVDLWLLGDYLGMPEMQDYVIGEVFTKMTNRCGIRDQEGLVPNTPKKEIRPPFHLVQRVWAATTPASLLRSLFIDVLTSPRVFTLTCEARKVYDFPNEALEEFLQCTARYQYEVLNLSERLASGAQHSEHECANPEYWGHSTLEGRCRYCVGYCVDCNRLGTAVRKELWLGDYRIRGPKLVSPPRQASCGDGQNPKVQGAAAFSDVNVESEGLSDDDIIISGDEPDDTDAQDDHDGQSDVFW